VCQLRVSHLKGSFQSALPIYEPVPGVAVSAFEIIAKPNSDSIELKLVKTVVTGARGEYRFESLPAGNYVLRARAPGFYDARIWDVWVWDSVNSNADLFLQVAAIGDYAPGMAPERGSIYGAVHSLLDKPIADVLITAFCADTMGPVFQTRTDDKGEFRLDVVRYGRYVVTYSKAHSGFGSKGVDVHGRKQVQLKFSQ
jgi:hypothetical protein